MNKLGMCVDDSYYVLPPLKGKTVLEVGCNYGKLATHIVNQGASKYLGIDIWPPEGEREKLQSPELFSRFQYGDVNNRDTLPYDQSWDVVVMFGVLYHLANPLQALINMRDLTKETLVVGTAYHLSDESFLYFEPGHRGDVTNLWYPTRKCLLRMFWWLGLVPDVKYTYPESKFFGTFHDRICIHGHKPGNPSP